MEEIGKMLGPWPVLQLIFGLAVLAGGVWMIVKGSQKREAHGPAADDERDRWEAYQHLRNIEENSFKQVALMTRAVEELQRISAILWNQGGGR